MAFKIFSKDSLICIIKQKPYNPLKNISNQLPPHNLRIGPHNIIDLVRIELPSGLVFGPEGRAEALLDQKKHVLDLSLALLLFQLVGIDEQGLGQTEWVHLTGLELGLLQLAGQAGYFVDGFEELLVVEFGYLVHQLVLLAVWQGGL